MTLRAIAAAARVLAVCIFLSPGSRAETGAEATAGAVKVAAYNLENYLPVDRWVDGRLVPGAMKPESEIVAAVRIVAACAPDILLLVEMGDREKLADFQARLRGAGLAYPHAVWVAGADPHRHLAALSKFPVVADQSENEIPFELDGRPQMVSRGLLDATFEPWPGHRLRLLGAHLKSRREVPDFDQVQFRAREALLVRERVNRIFADDPGALLVLAGDLNDTKNEFPVRELIGTPGSPAHMADVWLKDSRGERWTHYWKTADIYSRIDFILVSPRLLRMVDRDKSGIADPPDWNSASDHRLIFATFEPPMDR